MVWTYSRLRSTGIQAPSSDPGRELPAPARPRHNADIPASRPPNGSVVDPPLRVESREELVYLLGEACELEHGLLCEYLYAQFSLKRSLEEGLKAEQLARVQAWELTLIDLIKQEM